MFKVILFVVMTLLSRDCLAHWLSADCSDYSEDNSSVNELFTLAINRSFESDNIEFKFCANSNKELSSYLLIIADSKNGHDSVLKSIKLKPSESEEIVNQFELAWDYNKRDKNSGMDGSYWCLTTRNAATFTKGCFWSPTSNADTRGLSGLSTLGSLLWTRAGLTLTYGPLL